jgi:hypothetical protein
MKCILLTLATICFGCVVAQAQTTPPARHDSSSKPSEVANKPELSDVKPEPAAVTNRLTLKDLGPLSPEEAARITARSLARQKDSDRDPQAAEKKEQSKNQATDSGKPDDAVAEFQPAGSGSGTGSSATVVQDKQNKSPLKRVHGDLYGAKNGVGRADGGSVGGTSKSGKTSIYVQSDQAHTTAPLQQ